MRLLALAVVFLCSSALAADYSPWGEAGEPIACIELAQAVPGVPRTSSGPACCKRCGFSNKKPCGDTCIDPRSSCWQPPGCACP